MAIGCAGKGRSLLSRGPDTRQLSLASKEGAGTLWAGWADSKVGLEEEGG